MGSIDGHSWAKKLSSAIFLAAFVCSAHAAAEDPKKPAPSGQKTSAEKAKDLPAADTVAGELARLSKEAYGLSPGAQKRSTLAELASLRELAGDVEGAAAAWADAAFAESEGRDGALMEAARCLIALGELDRASADLRTVLITGRDADAISKARYLGAQIAAFRAEADAAATLGAFVDDPAYADRRPATLYLLWRTSADESVRARLIADHAASPEAALASSSASVSVAPTPLWLFFPGRSEVLSPLAAATATTAATAAAAPPAEVAPAPLPPQTAQSLESGAAPPAKSAQASTGETIKGADQVLLQIGLFRQVENATVLMKRLEAAGFKAALVPRRVGSDDYHAVTVAGGPRPDETAIRLKDAGFESFPLY